MNERKALAIPFPPAAVTRGFMNKEDILAAGISPHRVPTSTTSVVFYVICAGQMIGVYDDVRGRPVNAPSRCPQTRSIRTTSLPDTTVTTNRDFAQSVLSVSGD
jgi:hypothetical protein